ncbi:SMAD/FHA domain-containing protein [Rozella allomycis CSF55]|uniref:Forkhead-associated (FHA) domain-containing protein n=1 Tax=Rozella allomycis (strain CSF55) TaxID=988480 RepID=A0A075AX85_ROZAC|nr:Forkhead-associated (FHA) domain-containing protein [Rozella allomycis CSF55]RKP18544.1 SMAD/FHA domain-containing protein [Rozella allomycis CSF55]|eukprot:EPZ33337.1 Forkhead-associated (FHA) domain-containing protein [Rozella allomycis CSF55]
MSTKEHSNPKRIRDAQSLSPKSPANPKKEKPNFNTSGKLNADMNTFNGVVLKYSEPPEGRKPGTKWRMYVFKGKEQIDMFELKQSAYLLGRERLVADIPIDHPSCSKQHAAIQFRQVASKNGKVVIVKYAILAINYRPYVIDLESSNGTFLNDAKIDPSKYYEIKSKDMIKFGFSTREYVFINELLD